MFNALNSLLEKRLATVKSMKGIVVRARHVVRGPDVRIVSGKRLWAMKRKAQARDRELVARWQVPPEAMLFLRPEHLQDAKIDWPDASLNED